MIDDKGGVGRQRTLWLDTGRVPKEFRVPVAIPINKEPGYYIYRAEDLP